MVNVTILRSGLTKPLDYTITRGQIPLYSLDIAYLVKPGIGYMKISRFASTTYDEFLNAFNDLSKQGMTKLILDLRGNGGGFLKTAVELADEFLMKGLQIVYTEGKSHPKKTYNATSFEDAEELLNYIQFEPPDLFICDLMMPKVDGWEVIQKVKEKHPNIHIIVGTALNDYNQKECAKILGCGFWQKGKFSELRKMVEAVDYA